MNLFTYFFPKLAIKQQYPQYGDFITITNMNKYKHMIGLTGFVKNSSKKFLIFENENVKTIIDTTKCQIEYESLGKKYKIG